MSHRPAAPGHPRPRLRAGRPRGGAPAAGGTGPNLGPQVGPMLVCRPV